MDSMFGFESTSFFCAIIIKIVRLAISNKEPEETCECVSDSEHEWVSSGSLVRFDICVRKVIFDFRRAASARNFKEDAEMYPGNL